MLRLTKSVKTYVSLANKMPTRRFPPPWTVEDFDASFVVKDNGGQTVATIGGVKLLMTKDEATRIAANIGKLPELA